MIKIITIINEKSSQADNFAAALGGYKGQMPASSNLAGEDYQIVYAAGHLYAFKDLKDMVPEDEVEEFTSWDSNDLPFDRTQINWRKHLNPNTLGKGAKTYMATIKPALNASDKVIIATDYDPSGEGNLLGWEIVEGAGFKGEVYRCHHEDESPAGILKAFKHLARISDDPNSQYRDGLLFKAKAREKFDYLTIQYVRVLTDLARKDNVLPMGAIVRAGRLKSAMIQKIGEDENAHEHFSPHSDFQPVLVDEDGHKFIKKDAEFYKTEQEAKDHENDLPQDAVSKEIKVEPLVSRPPKMLDLSTAGARLGNQGYNTKTVQDLAEKMYQDKVLSYPRTEDSVITKDQLAELVPLLPKICKLVGVDQALIDPNGFRSYLIGSGSHGANRPGPSVPDSMDDIKALYGDTGAALYDAFARSFLAGFAKDKKSERHVYADSTTGEYIAKATVVTDPGWSAVFDEHQGEDEDAKAQREKENHKLFNVGQKLTPDVWEKKATRPGLTTMTKLMNFLKGKSIGTGATRMQTFNDISQGKSTRKLINVKRSKLTLNTLGMIGFLTMDQTSLSNPTMTKNLEGYLNDIKTNKVHEIQVLKLFDKMFMQDKAKMIKNSKRLNALPKVKQNAHQKVKGTYASNGPEEKYRGKEVSFSDGFGAYKFTQQNIDDLLAGKEIVFIYSGEKKIKCQGRLMDREKYGFGFAPTKWIYPKRPTVKGIYQPKNVEVEFGATFGGHKFTQDEINFLLAGNTVSYPAKSKAGKKYTAKVKLVYGIPFGSKSKDKTWHIGFDESGKKKYTKKK